MRGKFFTFLFLLTLILPINIYAEIKEPIVIAAFMPLSTAVGSDIKRGIELAVHEVNAAGGVLGKPLKVIFEDTGPEPVGVSLVKKVLERHRASLFLEGYLKGVSSEAVEYLRERRMVQIPIGWDYPFFNLMDLKTTGNELGKFALSDSGAERVGFIKVDNVIGKEIGEWVKKVVEQSGGKVVSEVTYAGDQRDYFERLKTLFRHEPQIVFFIPIGAETRLILQQTSQIGFKVKTGWYSPYIDLWKNYLIPEIAEGIKGIGVGIDATLYSKFIYKFKGKFNEVPKTILSAYAYDAIKFTALTLNRAKSEKPDIFVRAWADSSQTHRGVTGNQKFDQFGRQIPQKYGTVVYEKGELVPYAPCPVPPFCRKQIIY